jgi:hypothetical protein
LIDQTTKSKIICASGGFYGMDNGFNSQYLGSFPKEKEITMWDARGKIYAFLGIFLWVVFIVGLINSDCTPKDPIRLLDSDYNSGPALFLEFGQPLISR